MDKGQIYQFGSFQLIPEERLLLRGREAIDLPPKVFHTLVMLVCAHGHVVTKEELMRAIWPDSFVEEGNLTRNISVLRKALTSDNGTHQYIDTVPKVGYRFVAEVQEAPPELVPAIEKLTVTRTTTLAEEEISLRSDTALKIAARVRSLRWPAKIAIALAAFVILATSLGLLLSRPSPKAPAARGATTFATFTQLSTQPGVEVFPSLSPDGKLLVYASDREGNWDIYLQRLGGETVINLTADNASEDTHPVFSPDGDRIAFRSWRAGGGLFVMGATGENVRRIADFGFHPAWSPNGSEVVCSMARVADPSNRGTIPSQLWTINVTTGARRLITNGDAVQPQWSPNGNRIAFWGLQKGGQRDIWTISADGTHSVAVTDDEYFNWNPIWSPDGKYLYYVGDRGGSMNLWRVRIEEQSGKVLGQPEPVTTPSSYSQHIAFSRDGERIAYVEVANRRNIKRVAFNPLTERLSGESSWITQGDKQTASPDVSPDGEWVVFSSLGAKQEDIFLVRSDGSGLRQLTDDTFRDRGPRWSKDGKQVAFYSDRGGKYEIWTINLDGSELRQVTTTALITFYPVWSPDNLRLVYRTRGSPTSIINLGVNWTEQSPETLPPLSSDAGFSFVPWSWSPDGQRLAGWRSVPEEAHAGIYLYLLDSKRYEMLTEFGNRPVWLNDNRRLFFFYKDKIYLLDTLSGRTKELLSTAPDQIQGLTASRDGTLICFSIEASESSIWAGSFK